MQDINSDNHKNNLQKSYETQSCTALSQANIEAQQGTALVEDTLPTAGIKLSVCVAVYNVELYVRQCLESLIAQTYKNVEFVVVDDGSTDGSGAICDEIAKRDSRFRVIHLGINKGSLVARKTAIIAAKGDYISFLDGDDLYTTEKSVELLCEQLDKNQVDILRFDFVGFGTNKHRVKEVQDYLQSSHQGIKLTAFEALDHIYAQGLGVWSIGFHAFKSSILKKVASVCPNDHFVCIEDAFYVFLALYYAKSYIAVSTPPLYSYRIGTGISTRSITINNYEIHAKERRIVRWIEEILTKDGADATYFKIVRILLNKLSDWAIGQLRALNGSERKEGLDLLVKENFNFELLQALKRANLSFIQQGELAQDIYGANCLKSDDRSTKTLAVIYNRYTREGVRHIISLQLPILVSLGYKVVLITESISPESEYPVPDSVIREVIPEKIDDGRLTCLDEILSHHLVDTVLYYQSPSCELLLWDILTIKLKKVRMIMAMNEAPLQDYAVYSNLFRGQLSQALPYILRLTDQVIVLSKAFVPYYASYGCSVQVMPNPLTFDMNKVEVAPLSMRDGVLWLGRLQDCQKHWIDALYIMRRLVQLNPDSQCFIAGIEVDPNSAQTIKNFIAENTLEEHIHWLGESHNVQHLLSRCRAYLFTSSFETSPKVLAEAKVCGTPVVAFDIPYLELLQEQAGCLVIKQRDGEAAAQALNKILNDDNLASQMISASRNSIENYYRQHDLKQRWKDLLGSNTQDHGANSSNYEQQSIRELLDMQVNFANSGIARLEDVIRAKDQVINDKTHELNIALMPKPARRYNLFKVLTYAVRGKLGFSRKKRTYYRNKLGRIFTD